MVFKLVQFRTARITEQHQPITKATLANYPQSSTLILHNEKRIPLTDDLQFLPREGDVFVFDLNDLAVAAHPRAPIIQNDVTIRPLSSYNDDWRAYASDCLRILEDATTFNDVNFNIVTTSETEIETLMKGYRQLLVYLETELRETETQSNYLLKFVKETEEQARLVSIYWQVLKETTAHPALDKQKRSLTHIFKGGENKEAAFDAVRRLLTQLNPPLTQLIGDISLLKDRFASLKEGMATHLEDTGNRRAAQLLVEELRRVKGEFKASEQLAVLAFSQSSAPRVGQNYLAIAEKTSVTLKQRENFLAWLNERMRALREVHPALEPLRKTKEMCKDQVSQLKEFSERMGGNSLESIVKVYGFSLLEKIFRAKFREVLESVRADSNEDFKALAPSEESRQKDMKPAHEKFPGLRAGHFPTLRVVMEDPDGIDQEPVESRHLADYCAMLRAHTLSATADSIESLRKEYMEMNVIQFERKFISSNALREKLRIMTIEKEELEREKAERQKERPPETALETRIRELEEALRKKDLEIRYPKDRRSGPVSPIGVVPAPSPGSEKEVVALETLRRQHEQLQREHQELQARYNELNLDLSQLSDVSNSSFAPILQGVDWKQKYHGLELEAQEQQRILEAQLRDQQADSAARVAELTKQLKSAEQQVASLETSRAAEVSTRDKELEKTQGELRAKDSLLQQAQQDLNAKGKALETTQEELTVKDKQCQQGQEELRSKGKELEKAQRELRAKDSQLQQTQQQLNAKTKALETTQEELKVKDKQCQQVQQELKSMTNELQRVQEELKSRNQTLEQSYVELGSRTKNAQDALERSVMDGNALRTHLEACKSELLQLRRRSDGMYQNALENLRYFHRAFVEFARLLHAIAWNKVLPEALTEDYYFAQLVETGDLEVGRLLHDMLQYNDAHLANAKEALHSLITELVSEFNSKIAINDFKLGDKVIFFPTRSKDHSFLAFSPNTDAPKYELVMDDLDLSRKTQYVIGTIVSIEPRDEQLTAFKVIAEVEKAALG